MAEKEIDAGKIPCILFGKYKSRYVDKYLNEKPKGIKKEEWEDFTKKNNVRTLDELSFRLLNYILYSHLFISNMLGNIKKEYMNNYTHGSFTC